MHILDFFIFQTTEAENPPPKGPNICTFIGFFMLTAFMAALLFLVIAGGNAAQTRAHREQETDRKILRQMYANQKLHLFGKDELQMKLFAEEIIELIGKF